jgi:CubicO group peptidase (beta-lactamase class C family)
MRFLCVFGILFAGFFVDDCSKFQNSGNKIEQIAVLDTVKIKKEINADYKSKLIAQLMNSKIAAGFNGNAIIMQKGIIIYESSNGFASIPDTIRLTKNSKFQLASLSKTFAAVATMKLVEEGKIGLDSDMRDYYPNFPYEGVSIRSLLSHRSGLPYYQYEFDKKVRAGKIYPSNQQMMEWFETTKPTPKIMNQPDHYFAYNNTNFAVLAALVEKVSGLTYNEFLKQKLLAPAGMFDTFSANKIDLDSAKNLTVGHQFGGKLPKDYYDDIVGDKGIYSTTSDLVKWYEALKSEKILLKETLREMYTPRSFEHPGLRNYGYGFRLWVNEKQQTDYIYHTGWWKGYNTIMFFDLREDFVIILLSNKYNKNVYNIKEIVNVLQGNNKASTLEDNILDQ